MITVLILVACVLGTFAVAPVVRRRLTGPVFTLDEISEEISYELPLDAPIPYTLSDTGVALAWSQAAAPRRYWADEHADDVQEPDGEVFDFDADLYYGDLDDERGA
ncbi:hypothetical protein [Nocardioides sp. InS609-2]|uniref:hypothetical protein n=1 Tax=Nocardioides sp. InS609-2 TaxID=2760705 RepID=UPI0020C0BFC3|nr:hypothetical protein [Nocardioides sp. InS609-2]